MNEEFSTVCSFKNRFGSITWNSQVIGLDGKWTWIPHWFPIDTNPEIPPIDWQNDVLAERYKLDDMLVIPFVWFWYSMQSY